MQEQAEAERAGRARVCVASLFMMEGERGRRGKRAEAQRRVLLFKHFFHTTTHVFACLPHHSNKRSAAVSNKGVIASKQG